MGIRTILPGRIRNARNNTCAAESTSVRHVHVWTQDVLVALTKTDDEPGCCGELCAVQLSITLRWFLLEHAQTDIPASAPEQAYQTFVAWQPTHGGYLMPLDVFTTHFIAERRALRGT
jgi:hypothetical protein